jgi:hypothetical protein
LLDDKELIVDKVVLINKDPYDGRLKVKDEGSTRLTLGCAGDEVKRREV